MKYLKTFEEKTPTKSPEKPKPKGDTYTKIKYCYKCEQFAKHLNGKCLNCKRLKDQEKAREKQWGVK